MKNPLSRPVTLSVLPSLSLAAFSPARAQAQSKSAGDFASLYKACTNYLDCAIATATAERERWKNEIRRLSQQGTGFKVCDFDRASVLYKYYDWMVRNQNALKEMDRGFLGINEQVREKVAFLQGTTIDVLTVEGQDGTSKRVSFAQITEYLRNLNERAAGTPADQFAALMRVQENWLSNPLELAHSQIIAAIEKSNTLINASLKEKSSEFSVSLVRKNQKFEYILTYKGQPSGIPVEITVSLLKKSAGAGEVFGLSESEKWAAILKSGGKVDGFSLDGQMRLAQMQLKHGDPSCRNDTILYGFVKAGFPLVTDTVAALRPGRKLGQTEIWLSEFCSLEPSALVANVKMDGRTVYTVIDDATNNTKADLSYWSTYRDFDLSIQGGRTETIDGDANGIQEKHFVEVKKRLGCDSL